jgi:hypothetical protein
VNGTNYEVPHCGAPIHTHILYTQPKNTYLHIYKHIRTQDTYTLPYIHTYKQTHLLNVEEMLIVITVVQSAG